MEAHAPMRASHGDVLERCVELWLRGYSARLISRMVGISERRVYAMLFSYFRRKQSGEAEV